MRALFLIAALTPAIASAFAVEVLRQTGPADKRIDIVIVGDGYRAQDQAQLTSDATNLLSSLFAATPWAEYQALFNARLIHVQSNQNGADNGTYGASRDTALGAYFNCAGIDRLICFDASKLYPILSSHTPDYDLAIVVVNDPKYGGSGGSIPTTSINASSGQIVIHEVGHSIGGLTDEYESAYPGFPTCGTDCPEANATKNATSSVKWAAWIPSGTPIPTPEGNAGYAASIGVFEGCRYQTSGVFRPKDQNCKMKTLGAPNCSVCTEQLVKSFWNRVPSMFDAKSPANAKVTDVCGSVTFAVVPLPIQTTPGYGHAWYVDDVVQAETGPSFTYAPTSTAATVKVVSRDNTALVRSDPNGLLEASTTWTVQAGTGGCPVGLCDLSASCLADGGCERTSRPSGASCATPTCTNGVKSWIGTCDGDGGCSGPAGSRSCGAYGCDDANVDCRTQCALSAHCRAGFGCVNEACVPLSDDAGSADAGPVMADAGVSDAGSGVDAGLSSGGGGGGGGGGLVGDFGGKGGATPPAAPQAPRGPCGCSHAGAAPLLLMAALALGRRRRLFG